MQPTFPTKKFFIVLLFLVLVAGGTFKLFSFLNNPAAPNTAVEQKLAVVQNNEALLRERNTTVTPAMQQRVATSTLNAVAAVVYLNEQTKANGATMDQITAATGKQIQDSINKLAADTYTKNNVVIINDNSPEALRKYGNTMEGIFLYYGKGQQSSSYLEIIKKALEKKDPKEFKKLDPFVLFYKNTIKMSLLTPVPSSALSVHLNIVNSYAEMLAVLQAFQATSDDLPSAIAANSRLQKSSQRFVDSFAAADTFFKQNGIVLSEGKNLSLFAVIAK